MKKLQIFGLGVLLPLLIIYAMATRLLH